MHFLQGNSPESCLSIHLNFILLFLISVFTFLQHYGWFVVFGLGLAYFLKSKLQPHLDRIQQQKEDAAHHKGTLPNCHPHTTLCVTLINFVIADSDKTLARDQAMEAARARMQAKHDEEAKVFAEKQKQVSAENVQMSLQMCYDGLSHRKKKKEEKQKLKGSIDTRKAKDTALL